MSGSLQPLLFAVESITKGWMGTGEGPPAHPQRKKLMLLRKESFVTVVKVMALTLFPTLMSLALRVFADGIALRRLSTKAEFVRRCIQSSNRGETLK